MRKNAPAAVAAVLSAILALGPGCKTSSTPPPPPPVKVEQSGAISDIFSGSPISGMEISGADTLVTTDGAGNYTIKYTQGTTPVLTMSHGNYITRKTFPGHGPNYRNIPNTVDLTTLNEECRATQGVSQRWTSRPPVYITSINGTAIPPQLETLIRSIVNNDFPKLTDGYFTGLTITKELNYSNVPTTNAFVFNYNKSQTFNAENDTRSGNVISYAKVSLGGYNGQKTTWPWNEVMHEAGHGLGLDHTTTSESVMAQGVKTMTSLPLLDQHNSSIKYARPAGNSSPDNDPAVADAWGVAVSTYDEAVMNEGSSTGFFDFDPTGMRDTMRSRQYNMRRDQIMREDQARLKAYEQERINAPAGTKGARN